MNGSVVAAQLPRPMAIPRNQSNLACELVAWAGILECVTFNLLLLPWNQLLYRNLLHPVISVFIGQMIVD